MTDCAGRDQGGVASSPGTPGAPRSGERREGPPLGPLEGVGPYDTMLPDPRPQSCRKAHLGGFKHLQKARVCVCPQLAVGPPEKLGLRGETGAWDSRDLSLPVAPSGGLRVTGPWCPRQAPASTNRTPRCPHSSMNWMGTPRGRSSWTTCSASCRNEVRPALPPWATGGGAGTSEGQ